MKSVKSLIQELNFKRDSWEFKALSLIDDHVSILEAKVKALESRNMRYFVRAHKTTVTVVAANVLTAIAFNATEYPQFGNMHDNTVQPARIYIRRNGVYNMFGAVQFESSAGGTYREVGIYLIRNGVTTALAIHSNGPLGAAGVSLHLPVSTAHYLYVDDIIFLAVLHDTAPNLDIEIDYPHSPYLAVSERMEDLDPSQYGLLNPEANMR